MVESILFLDLHFLLFLKSLKLMRLLHQMSMGVFDNSILRDPGQQNCIFHLALFA